MTDALRFHLREREGVPRLEENKGSEKSVDFISRPPEKEFQGERKHISPAFHLTEGSEM